MKRSVCAAALFLGFAILVAGATTSSQAQEKKDKDKKATKWAPAVDFTMKAGKEWLLKQAALGNKMASDKDYVITALPKDLVGSTYVQRTSGDHGQWFPEGGLKAKKDATAFAVIRVKYNGKDVFGEVDQSLLTKDGWTEVDGKAATTFPGKENWEWKTYKKDIKEGDVSLQLENLKWPGTAVMFFFK